MIQVMKKIFYLSILALAGVMLVSCEPVIIKGPEAGTPISSGELQSAFTIVGQYADAACTQPMSDGNYIKYTTNPSQTVQVFNYKSDGSKNVLATGASGVFNITPRRGADSNQPFGVSTINQDASLVFFESSVNVYVPADLDPAVKVLTGESGSKAWKWNPMNGSTWGNAGYIGDAGHGANVAAGEIPGLWWGCLPEQLETEQIQHSGGVAYGYGSSDAYMVFNSVDGIVTSYDQDGKQIASSPYSVENFSWNSGAYKMGDLVTAGGSGILWPFIINTGGTVADNYEIVYMDGNLLTLICANGQAAWSWGECTWWRFQPVR